MGDFIVAVVGAIIQARMGSSRLPNKVLAEFCENKNILEYLIERLKLSEKINKIVIATTCEPRDKEIISCAIRSKVDYFTGSENDVLSRFFNCAKYFSMDTIVRITADDPFKDPQLIDHAIKILDEGGFDYVSNTIKPTFPEGIDIEVIKFNALKESYLNAVKKSEREHVTPYIWKNPEKFNLYNIESENDYSDLRLTIDYIEDLDALKEIAKFYGQDLSFSYKDIVHLINENKVKLPKTIRNEGYLKSIREDDE